MRRVCNRSRYLSTGEVWLGHGAMIQRYMGTGRFDTSNTFIWKIATKNSWGETNVSIPQGAEKLSIFSTNHRFSWQIWPPVSQSYLRTPDLSPDIFSLPRKSRTPKGSMRERGRLVTLGFAIDNNETCCINDGKPAIPTKTTSQSTNWMDGMSLKANRYLFLYRCFFVS